MGLTNLDRIHITPLDKVVVDGGNVMHAIKSSSSGFVGFGEAYFSMVNQGAIKAWKCHHKMTLNLVVPIGEVRFVFFLAGALNNFRVEDIGEQRYVRLTVPPQIWFGFQGRASGHNMVMNVADIEHDPNEVSRKQIVDVPYRWCET